MDSETIAMIPARYASTRIPKKLLIPIHGKPLILHTLENALEAFDKVYVATDHVEIKDLVKHPRAEVIMTSPNCKSGTERIFEAFSQNSGFFKKTKYIVNIQGDHPCIDAKTMLKTHKTLIEADPSVVMATPVTKLSKEELNFPHIVKCLVNQKGLAMYFSRSPIPFLKKQLDETPLYRHIGMYVYRADFLLKTYGKLSPTPYQQAEDLEQLKILEHGFPIAVTFVDCNDMGVDIPEDIKKVEKLLCQ